MNEPRTTPPASASPAVLPQLAATARGAMGHLLLPGSVRRLAAPAAGALATHISRWQASADIYAAVIRLSRDTGSPESLPEPADAITIQHQLVWQIDRFTKPVVALLDAPHGGIAAGLTLFGTHRAASEAYALVADDLKHGQLPAFGLTVVLGRLPGQLGPYYALTGRPMDRATAHRFGLITHLIPAARFPGVEAALENADCIDPILDSLHDASAERGAAASELAAYEGTIEQAFAGDTLDEIVTALRSIEGPERPWARKAADELAVLDPVLVAATLALLRRPHPADLRTRLTEDQRAALHASTHRRTVAGAYEGLPPELWTTLAAAGERPLPVPAAIPSVPVPGTARS